MFAPAQNEARLRFRHGRFEIVAPGDFVRCAVTGARIPLDELRYWDVDRQRPYADAWAAMRDFDGTNIP